jgi:8-oxo-dGTP diphosphatase
MPYFKPSVTVDALVIWPSDEGPHVLLIQRKRDPFSQKWALPGGFIEEDETLLTSVARELAEETGLTDLSFTQFGAYGDPGRDPRGRTLTIAYYAVVEGAVPPEVEGLDDAQDARWFSIHSLPELAFDHQEILQSGLDAYTKQQTLVESA